MLMRVLIASLLAVFAWVAPLAAREATYRAGFVDLTVAGDRPFPVVVWYPTLEPETTWQTSLRDVTAARNAAVANGAFPLILLSHGSGGNEFGHLDWAEYMARRGFIIAAPRHVGDSSDAPDGQGSDIQLTGRPWQAREALDAMLTDPRLGPSIDRARIGMIGFSAGGYTTLTSIGGRPDYGLWAVHCREHPEDHEFCPGNGIVPPRITRPGWALPPPIAEIKAAVAMAPAGILFDATGLAGISAPLRLYRAADDGLVRNVWNADNVAALLPHPPEVVTVPGDHYIFIAPCTPALATEVAVICTDAPNVDRAAIHGQIAEELVDFFDRNLGR
jgi:predicted dienelactone hydrolase